MAGSDLINFQQGRFWGLAGLITIIQRSQVLGGWVDPLEVASEFSFYTARELVCMVAWQRASG